MNFWSIRPRYIALALLCSAIIYSGLWFVEVAKARATLNRYVVELRKSGYGISAGEMAVSGYPLAIKVILPSVSIIGFPRLTEAKLTAPLLEARSWPWDPVVWRVSAPEGLLVSIPLNDQTASVNLGKVSVTADVGNDGAYTIEATAANTLCSLDGEAEKIADLSLNFTVPAKAATGPDAIALSFNLQLNGLTLTAPLGPLGSTIDSFTVEGSVNGPVPSKPLGTALSEWRDAGGTIEIRQTDLSWGKLSIGGNGTMSLDRDMQVQGAFSATLRGWSAGLDALTAAGSIKPDQANFLRMGLTLFSHPAADGTSELKAPITIQNGQLYVEKARLARFPRLNLPQS